MSAMRPPRYATLGDALRADVHRAIRIASAACLAFAAVEYVTTLLTYAGSTPLLVKARLVAVVASASALLWLPGVVLLSLIVMAPRLARHLAGGDGRAGRGFLAFPVPTDGPRAGPARLWAIVSVGLVVVAVLQRLAASIGTSYKDKQLAAVMIAVYAVIAIPLAVLAYRAAVRLYRWLAAELHPLLGVWSPIGRWRAAGAALAILVTGGILVLWFAWRAGKSAWGAVPLSQFRSFPPWHTLLPLYALVGGGALGSYGASRASRRPSRPRRRAHALVAAAAAALLIPLSLFRWGADTETKYVAITASPALARIVDAVRAANDLDGDGFGSLLGENDCAPFDPRIHPGVRDLPDDGIDQNCDGRDFSMRDVARPTGDRMPVPPAFKKQWNFLLLTVDTVRYDHTTFGGYATGPKKRDTTPQLAKLVDRATSFTFANAPSAGTMASVPAILTSKFFHSGIALDENVKKGMPPKLKPENVLVAEIMKEAGYATGAITSHEYFNDWGMNQGFESYDNEIGKDNDPFKITSSAITDRALAWISRQHGRKWFLWAHYIDPHGRYVAHPDHVSFGSTEEDLYDGELAYADKHIGRLLDELARLPGGDRTIVIITSDHGDGFGEHGFINHGQALYRELLHVPLIVAVPDNPPRKVNGAVTPLDIVPTMAELAGIDVSRYSFEGVSLVPQIFYGKEDLGRVVFAETNYPEPIRAAVSARQKLVFKLKNNIYELYDLTRDPWEKTNLWKGDAAQGAQIKDALDRWIERVLYARDPKFNQAAMRISDALLATRPTPPVATPNVTFDGGAIAVLGAGPVDPRANIAPGANLELYVYFEAKAAPSRSHRFQVHLWPTNRAAFSPTAPVGPALARSPLRETQDGLFATDRWRPGELVRDKFSIKLPPAWAGDAIMIGLVVDANNEKVVVDGPHPGTDKNIVILGMLPLTAPPAPRPPPPQAPVPPGGSPAAPRP